MGNPRPVEILACSLRFMLIRRCCDWWHTTMQQWLSCFYGKVPPSNARATFVCITIEWWIRCGEDFRPPNLFSQQNSSEKWVARNAAISFQRKQYAILYPSLKVKLEVICSPVGEEGEKQFGIKRARSRRNNSGSKSYGPGELKRPWASPEECLLRQGRGGLIDGIPEGRTIQAEWDVGYA